MAVINSAKRVNGIGVRYPFVSSFFFYRHKRMDPLIKSLLITLINVEEQSIYITLNRGREIYIPDEIADK